MRSSVGMQVSTTFRRLFESREEEEEEDDDDDDDVDLCLFLANVFLNRVV
jgi:hypothetical protein